MTKEKLKIVCVLYDDPVDGYPPKYARGDIPKLSNYPDGQTMPSPINSHTPSPFQSEERKSGKSNPTLKKPKVTPRTRLNQSMQNLSMNATPTGTSVAYF